MSFRKYIFISLSLFAFAGIQRLEACDTCGCSFNAQRARAEAHASGPMLTTPTASTLGQGRASAGFMFEHQRYDKLGAAQAHALHHQGHDVHGKNHEEYYNINLGYGLLDSLDFYLSTPLVSKTSFEVHEHAALGRGERASGFGDMRLVAKYRFWSRGVDAALLLGLKAPTGKTSNKNQSGEKFEPELQPGSGGWDFNTGLAVSRSFRKRLSLASAFQYTYRGEGGQAFNPGDLFRYDLGVSYALKPLGTAPNLSLVLELHNQWASRDASRESDKVLDSGGTTVLLNPGLTAELTENLSAFCSMPVPVYQNLGGAHEELRYEVLAGATWTF